MCKKEYDIAQICENGHIITIHLKKNPWESKKYCPQCSEKTITQCPYCGNNIQGSLDDVFEALDDVIFIDDIDINSTPKHIERKPIKNDSEYILPSYCFNCGKPFPWTNKLFHNVDRLLKEINNLTPKEKNELKSLIPNLIIETPDTTLSAIKVKNILNPVKDVFKDAFKEILKTQITTIALKILNL